MAPQMVRSVVISKLMDQEMEKSGFKASAEVTRKYITDQLKKASKEQLDMLTQQLAMQGKNLNQHIDAMVSNPAVQKGIAKMMFAEQTYLKNIKVTEDEAKKYYDAGRYQEASDLYAKLTGSNAPDGYADIPVVGQAQCLEALGRPADALKAYEAFLTANPKSYLALTAKLGAARARALTGDTKTALARLADMKTAAKDDPLATARIDATEDCIKRLPKK
jgi:tetratricopeptide (TPR) repeat protein